MIRIQIVRGRGLVSRLIGFETRSWASHVELVDTTAKVTLGARARGGLDVRHCSLDRYERIEQFVLNHSESPQLLQRAWDWLYQRRGAKYGFGIVLGVALDWERLSRPVIARGELRLDCSMAVHLALWHGAGFPALSTRPSALPARVTPRDFLLSRALVYVPAGVHVETQSKILV